jgi:hypothetical protein
MSSLPVEDPFAGERAEDSQDSEVSSPPDTQDLHPINPEDAFVRTVTEAHAVLERYKDDDATGRISRLMHYLQLAEISSRGRANVATGIIEAGEETNTAEVLLRLEEHLRLTLFGGRK